MKFGTIGAGKMGYSIISGIANAGLFEKKDICVYDVNNQTIEGLLSQGYCAMASIQDIFDKCDVVLFAVKPQELNNVLSSIQNVGRCSLVLSIMAGVPISKLEVLSDSLAVVRIMPNTCALIGESASSICYNKNVDEQKVALTRKIFASIGKFVEIDESLMDEVIPVGGSFTAYAYTFMKAFIDSSVKRGIPQEIATNLVIQSMIGSAKMVEKYGDIDTLIKNVCSKGGTTLAGLYELQNANFDEIIDKCAIACAERSKELGKM